MRLVACSWGLPGKAADSASEQIEPPQLFLDLGEGQTDEDFENAMSTRRIEVARQA